MIIFLILKFFFSDIEKRFPEPKAFLHNIFTVVTNEIKIANCLTSHMKHVALKKKTGWSFTYEIKWPEQQSFTSVGLSKASASSSAALKTLHWLNLNNRINGRFPVVYEKNERVSLLSVPEELKIEKKVLDKIDEFLNRNEKVSNSNFVYKERISDFILIFILQLEYRRCCLEK